MNLQETLPTPLGDVVPEPGSDVDVADVVAGALERGMRLRRRRRLATASQAAFVLVAVAVAVTITIATLTPHTADQAMRPTPQAAASIAPERFPPTPYQAAATLRSLLPPGSIVSDVPSNPGKTGGQRLTSKSTPAPARTRSWPSSTRPVRATGWTAIQARLPIRRRPAR
jgi:hypothetical protein